jgi:hypothetical protein
VKKKSIIIITSLSRQELKLICSNVVDLQKKKALEWRMEALSGTACGSNKAR